MFRLLQYMIRRDIKIYIIGIIINIFLVMAVKMNLLQEGIPTISKLVLGLYTVLLFLLLCDRLTWYIEQGMIFDNREYFMSIPVSLTKILNSVSVMATAEFAIWYGVMSFFSGVVNESDKGINFTLFRDFSLIVPMILAFIFFGSSLLAIIGNFTRNRLNGSIFLAIVVLIGIIVYFVLYSVFEVRIPFFYSWRIGFITLSFLLIGISYYGLWKKYGISENKLQVRIIVGVLVVVAALIYGFGQSNAYAHRETDEIPKEFIADLDVVGEWHLLAIDYSGTSIDSVDPLIFTDMKNRGSRYDDLKIYGNGTTNHDFLWSKGCLYNEKLQYTQQYRHVQDEDQNYLVIEWKSFNYRYHNGDYIHYYIYSK